MCNNLPDAVVPVRSAWRPTRRQHRCRIRHRVSLPIPAPRSLVESGHALSCFRQQEPSAVCYPGWSKQGAAIGGRGMEEPIVVALAESLRGPDGERVAAVSPRIRVAYVSPAGEPHDDVADAQVIYRGFGL